MKKSKEVEGIDKKILVCKRLRLVFSLSKPLGEILFMLVEIGRTLLDRLFEFRLVAQGGSDPLFEPLVQRSGCVCGLDVLLGRASQQGIGEILALLRIFIAVLLFPDAVDSEDDRNEGMVLGKGGGARPDENVLFRIFHHHRSGRPGWLGEGGVDGDRLHRPIHFSKRSSVV